jgi:hypothetical protein
MYLLFYCFFILLAGEGGPTDPTLHVVIIWRRDTRLIKYDWLPDGWGDSEQPKWNETREQLGSTIQRLLQSSEALSYEAVVQVCVLYCNYLLLLYTHQQRINVKLTIDDQYTVFLL